MIIDKSIDIEARKLASYIINNKVIYSTQLKPIITKLSKKKTFDKTEAVIAFYHVTTLASNNKFNASICWVASRNLVYEYMEEITGGAKND